MNEQPQQSLPGPGMDIGKYVDAIATCVQEKAHQARNDQGALVELVVSFTLDRDRIAQIIVAACEERVRNDPSLRQETESGIVLP